MKNHMENFEVSGKIVLITGSNRGIGRALVDEAIARGAKKVYAAARNPFTHSDHRVESISLDVTDSKHIEDAVQKISELDILINNAGVNLYGQWSDRAKMEQHFAVNFFGAYDMIIAFLPALIRSRGVIVNNLSALALAPLPSVPTYCISKAAAFSFTQSLRASLAPQQVTVQAIMTGPVDTDMNKELNLSIPMVKAEAAAQGIFDGIEKREEEIFPDPLSKTLADGWYNSVAKAFEKQNAILHLEMSIAK